MFLASFYTELTGLILIWSEASRTFQCFLASVYKEQTCLFLFGLKPQGQVSMFSASFCIEQTSNILIWSETSRTSFNVFFN